MEKGSFMLNMMLGKFLTKKPLLKSKGKSKKLLNHVVTKILHLLTIQAIDFQ